MQSLYFEHTMNSIFGEKAHQIAGSINNIKYRKEWLNKTIKKLIKDIDSLDAPSLLKKSLLNTLLRFQEEIKTNKTVTWHQVDILLRFCLLLLGYSNVKGGRFHSLVYWQNENQNYFERLFQGEDQTDIYATQKNVIMLRENLVKKLKNDGLDSFTIASILNTTEYEIKKILKN